MTEPVITLPLSVFRSLLFGQSGDIKLPVFSPQSIVVGDLAKIVVTHKAIGELVRDIDKSEQYFHVEIYVTHAEIWLEFEWKESNARRERFREYQRVFNEELFKKNDLLTELQDKLSATRLPDHHCRLIAEQIYGLFKQGKYEKVVEILDKAGLNIKETLEAHRNL